MEYKNYYQILGVAKNAAEKEIKHAYRKLARQFHPDRNPGDKAAEEKFKEVNEAYEVLGNAKNRARYDQLGSSYHKFRQRGGDAADFDFSQWFEESQSVNVDSIFGTSGFSEFFSSIFGGGQSDGQANAFARDKRRANGDVERRIGVFLEEVYTGTTRTLNQNGDTFTVKIPPGAKTGTKVRLRGKGNPGANGPGDLYLVVKVLPHESFKRVGDSVEVVATVDVITAVLGGKVRVPTLDGAVHLTIPAGTQGGQTFRLAGKGLPHLHQPDQFGDLLATVRIRIPTELSPEEQELYRQLADLSES